MIDALQPTPPRLRVAFAGTPAFAASALQAILDAGHHVPLVLTQPDRPAGRGMKLVASAVKQLALTHGLPLAQPHSLKLDGRHAQEAAAARLALEQAAPDLMVVAAYGLILPAWTLALPRLGCLNIHASLLPRWRGAAPIQRAIEAGDDQTGITIMQMDAGLDTGDMLLCHSLPIAPDATTASLHDALASLGSRSIVQALGALEQGGLHPQPQPEQGVSYAHKIDKAQAWLDWREPAPVLERRIRAFDPAPGAYVWLDTPKGREAVKVWRAQALTEQGQAGQVLQAQGEHLVVACGQGALALLSLQRPGGRRIDARDFLQQVALPAQLALDPAAPT